MIENFDEIYDLMEEAFPESEYRTYENQKKLFEKKEYKIITEKNDTGKVIAFLAYWNFKDFCFIEHIAVSSKCRGGGIGSKIMRRFIESANMPIILEIEPPIDEISNKRRSFYEKLGFKFCEYEYFQMPLRENTKPMRLNIMSYPSLISKIDFERFKKIIYENVYDINRNSHISVLNKT